MLIMLFPVPLSQETVDAIKTAAREQFSRIKSSHLTEAIAAGFDYKTNAAMRAALDANRAPGHFALVRFGKRLRELGYEAPADYLVDDISLSWSAQCLFSLMVASAWLNGAVTKVARLPIAQSMERMKEAGCGKETAPRRTSMAPRPAWSPRGPRGDQLALFIEHYWDAIQDIKTAPFQMEVGGQSFQWTLLRSYGFEQPFSEGFSFSLSDTAAQFAFLALGGSMSTDRGDDTAPAEIAIALDAYTLNKFGVDQAVYEGRLAAALPDHRLTFSIAADSPMAVGFPYAINMVSGLNDGPRLVMAAAEKVWRTMIEPSIEAIKALDGKIFAMLTADERQVLDFYRDRGRKHGITVEILGEGDFRDLAGKSREQADQLRAKTNSCVRVIIT